jgi:hypothetical protein
VSQSGPSGLGGALRALPLSQPVAWIIGPAISFVSGSWFAGTASKIAKTSEKPVSMMN